MSAEVLVVTRQFALRWGGGEHSIAAVVAALQAVRPAWPVTVSDGGFDPPGRLRPLPLIQLLLRGDALKQVAAGFHGRLALVQSLVGPAMLNALPRSVKTVFFLRDVLYWDQWANHETGKRRLAKSLYQSAQVPVVAAFRQQVRRAAARADLVVANSAFMAGRIAAVCGRQALVVHPLTPVAPAPLAPGEEIGIAGDGADKGGLILRALARRCPELRFRLHVRRPAAEPLPPNVTLARWESDPAELYRGLRLMLVPSQLAEAYGRVAIEALGHGVPVLVSRTGGLPEAVPGLDWTVADHRNPQAWSEALAAAYATAPERRSQAYTFARNRRDLVLVQHDDLISRILALVGEA